METTEIEINTSVLLTWHPDIYVRRRVKGILKGTREHQLGVIIAKLAQEDFAVDYAPPSHTWIILIHTQGQLLQAADRDAPLTLDPRVRYCIEAAHLAFRGAVSLEIRGSPLLSQFCLLPRPLISLLEFEDLKKCSKKCALDL